MKATLQKQRGFSVPALALALAITTVLAAYAGNGFVRRNNDETAKSTGRYLIAVRNALVAFQLKHEAWLTKVDTIGAPGGIYPDAPALTFTPNGAGEEIANADVALLKNETLLPQDFSENMPFGESAKLLLVRSGSCPGTSCQLQTYVYSCHPISSQRSSYTGASSCTNVPSGRDQVDPSLLGEVLMSVEGYGGHDVFDTTRFQGPLVNAKRTWFPISSHEGRVVVAASLDATPFAQFVRQGDTRHIFLRNDLTVDGVVQINTGLLFGNSVVLDQSCNREHMFSATAAGQLAVCRAGKWEVEGRGYGVTYTASNLPHNTYVAPPSCVAPAVPFRMIALQHVDMKVQPGSGMDVHGSLSGGVSGSGSVNAAGSVSVTGAFNGTFNAANSSYVEMGQSASLSATNQVVISPAIVAGRPTTATATVIQGCRFD